MVHDVGMRTDGTARLRFRFAVQVASRDRPLLETLKTLLGVGTIRDELARKSHWQPMSRFEVTSRREHRAAVIPFADQFLLPCAKRRQFENWLSILEEDEMLHPFPKGRSSCSVPRCSRLVRGKGLCRSHYYQATGY